MFGYFRLPVVSSQAVKTMCLIFCMNEWQWSLSFLSVDGLTSALSFPFTHHVWIKCLKWIKLQCGCSGCGGSSYDLEAIKCHKTYFTFIMKSKKNLILHTKQESRLREVCFFIEGENLVSLYSKQLEMSSPLETDCVCPVYTLEQTRDSLIYTALITFWCVR